MVQLDNGESPKKVSAYELVESALRTCEEHVRITCESAALVERVGSEGGWSELGISVWDTPDDEPVEMKLDAALSRGMLALEQQLSSMAKLQPAVSKRVRSGDRTRMPTNQQSTAQAGAPAPGPLSASLPALAPAPAACGPLMHLAHSDEAPLPDTNSWPRRDLPIKVQTHVPSPQSTRPASAVLERPTPAKTLTSCTCLDSRASTPGVGVKRHCHTGLGGSVSNSRASTPGFGATRNSPASRASTAGTARVTTVALDPETLPPGHLVPPPGMLTPGDPVSSMSMASGVSATSVRWQQGGGNYHLHDGLTPGQRALGAIAREDRFAAPRLAAELSTCREPTVHPHGHRQPAACLHYFPPRVPLLPPLLLLLSGTCLHYFSPRVPQLPPLTRRYYCCCPPLAYRCSLPRAHRCCQPLPETQRAASPEDPDGNHVQILMVTMYRSHFRWRCCRVAPRGSLPGTRRVAKLRERYYEWRELRRRCRPTRTARRAPPKRDR